MKFIKGNVYFCLHDMIIKKELAFKKGEFYTCSKDDVLIAENDVEQYMDDNTRWEYYFTPKGDNKSLDNVNHPPHYTSPVKIIVEKPSEIICLFENNSLHLQIKEIL